MASPADLNSPGRGRTVPNPGDLVLTMPQWIHDRAKHIRAKNPDMPESQSWAIATQQAHATGKSPKGYGTAEGKREAKQKYDEPKSEYKKTADPGHKSKTSSLALWMGFSDELQKIAAAASVGDVTKMMKRKSTLASTPKLTSKPIVKEPEPPSATLDHLSSSRTMPPPPVTMPGA
jgi:hypothetical protein